MRALRPCNCSGSTLGGHVDLSSPTISVDLRGNGLTCPAPTSAVYPRVRLTATRPAAGAGAYPPPPAPPPP